jgi:hypothetical protein
LQEGGLDTESDQFSVYGEPATESGEGAVEVVIKGRTEQDLVLWEDLLFKFVKGLYVTLSLFKGEVSLDVVIGAMACRISGVPE